LAVFSKAKSIRIVIPEAERTIHLESLESGAAQIGNWQYA
jgi:hypothetical protein